MKQKLVAYFSASGVTENAARLLAEAADADLFEIRPEKPYTDADLNWMNKKSRTICQLERRQTFRRILPKPPVLKFHIRPFFSFAIIFLPSSFSS